MASQVGVLKVLLVILDYHKVVYHLDLVSLEVLELGVSVGAHQVVRVLKFQLVFEGVV